MKRIILIFGGPSTEHDVSNRTADMVYANIDKKIYVVDRLKIHKDGKWQFLPGKTKFEFGIGINELKKRKYDVAFIAMHGYFGEDGHIQGILDSIKLPYTGSGMVASAMAMDKSVSNYLYLANKLEVPKFQVLQNYKDIKNIRMPVVVKPVNGGSSIATHIVRKQAELIPALKNALEVSKRVMVQEYVKGREFTCGVIEKSGEPIALIPTEIIPKEKFFDYKAKYTAGASREITPPNLDKKKIYQLQELALKAHNLLGCKGMSRSDFILKGSKFYILETNTIPGLTETSLLPQGAKAKNINFMELLNLIIKSANNE